jgi:uncharacterized membrane-anchored protein YhcB (DUF1043 family)
VNLGWFSWEYFFGGFCIGIGLGIVLLKLKTKKENKK